jgi:hypothetical protein
MAFKELFGQLPAGDKEAARCLILGEVTQSDDGNLGMAHGFIDTATNNSRLDWESLTGQ